MEKLEYQLLVLKALHYDLSTKIAIEILDTDTTVTQSKMNELHSISKQIKDLELKLQKIN